MTHLGNPSLFPLLRILNHTYSFLSSKIALQIPGLGCEYLWGIIILPINVTNKAKLEE